MPKKATPHKQLIDELLDSRIPKTEREHAAAREIERLREALAQPESEPVVWQFRMRPDWVLDKDFWEPWTNCTKEQAADYQRVPHLHDWTYESRALYTHPPQRQRQPLTNEELDALAIDEDGLPNSHFEFARAIEKAHGIGGKE